LLYLCVVKCFYCPTMGRVTLTKPISLRLSPQVRDKVKAVSEETGLLQAQVFDLMLKAACKALDEGAEDDSFPLPIEFLLVKK